MDIPIQNQNPLHVELIKKLLGRYPNRVEIAEAPVNVRPPLNNDNSENVC